MVLVSGATGYVAAHVIKQLQEAGYRVRGTVRSLKNEAKVKPIRELCPDAAHPIELVEADLLDADSWPKAVEGCKYVVHTASPFPSENPKHEDELIKPAVEGTLNVLRAAKDARTIKRVVLTSSTVAVVENASPDFDREYSEADFPDPSRITMQPYPKSKTLAERAAWDFVKEGEFELRVVNPGFVVGPPTHAGTGTSNDILKGVMLGRIDIRPVCVPCVDVRDVARAHVAAMTTEEAAGHRHCLVTDMLWYADMAQMETSVDDEINKALASGNSEVKAADSLAELKAKMAAGK